MPTLLNIADAIWWRVTPTVATLYYNRKSVLHNPDAPPALPNTEWANRERREMLSGSEDRLRNLEGKGPGLATVSAVVVAAVLLVLTNGWKESDGLARVIVGLAVAYALFSLLMPLYLVGPLKRNTVGVPELKKAATAADPEETLAVEAATAAMSNNLRNIRVANLLDASRRELSYAVGLLVVWLLLVPATGFLRVPEHRPLGAGGAAPVVPNPNRTSEIGSRQRPPTDSSRSQTTR